MLGSSGSSGRASNTAFRGAEGLVLDRSYFGAIESGEFNLTLATLSKVADGLGMPASTLLRRAQL